MRHPRRSCSSGSRRARRVQSAFFGVAAGLILVTTWCRPVVAHTWVVEWNPDNPTDQVGQAVISAASGDTVLVGPGRYFEHIPVASGKVLTLIGRDGAAATILDGSVSIPNRQGSIL
jgi:hypothetical protein